MWLYGRATSASASVLLLRAPVVRIVGAGEREEEKRGRHEASVRGMGKIYSNGWLTGEEEGGSGGRSVAWLTGK